MASGPNPVTITIGGDAGPLGVAAKQAGAHLAEMKTGMGKARETAMFFTQALGEFGPQGRTAQIAISGIAGAFLGGGGLLAALGLAQAAIRLVVEAWEAEAKAAEEARKKAAELAEERARAAQQSMTVVRGATDAYREANQRLKWELAGVSEEEIKRRETVAKLKAEVYGLSEAYQRTAQKRITEINGLAAENERLRESIELRREADAASKKAAKEAEERRKALADGPTAGSVFQAVDGRPVSSVGDYWSGVTAALERASKAVNHLATVDLPGLSRAEIDAANQGQQLSVALEEIAFTAMNFAVSELSSVLLSSMEQAGTVNERFTKEYEKLSKERRIATLLETGVAKNYAQAQAMVAAEAQAAEDAKTAATKEGMAQRLVAQAIEWGIKAVGALAEQNYVAAALYATAAAAAGGGAAVLHSQAASMTQGRGFTAAENDQLSGLQGGGGGSFSSGRSGGTTTVKETRIVFLPALMTEAEAAMYHVRADAAATRLDMFTRES